MCREMIKLLELDFRMTNVWQSIGLCIWLLSQVVGFALPAPQCGSGLCEQLSYCEPISATGPVAFVNPFRLSTKYCDDETGNYYYGYRYYNPNAGRWLSRDPIEEQGGLNLFAFVNNNTLTYVDLDGLGLFDIICNYSETAANVRGLHQLNEQARRFGYVDYNEAIKVLNEKNKNATYTPASPETTQVAAQLAKTGANVVLAGPMPEIQAASGGAAAAYALLKKFKCCNKTASGKIIFKLSAPAAEKAMLKQAKPDIDAFIGIIECSGEIRLFKAGEDGIFGHADLVRSKKATVGQTLGFSIGLNKQGNIEIINMSELNAHLGLGGTLPKEIIRAIEEVLK